MTTATTKYPNIKVRLSGQDGNIFNLIGVCRKTARKAGVPPAEIGAFSAEVMQAGSYDAALRVMMGWFDVS